MVVEEGVEYTVCFVVGRLITVTMCRNGIKRQATVLMSF